jgi:hypothetical protein
VPGQGAKRSIAAYLGEKRAFAGTAVRVVITPDEAAPPRFLARITTHTRGSTGERTFGGPTCTGVATAATLV